MIAQATHQKTESDNAIQDDHQNREHGVAAERRVARPKHDCSDQRHLDQHDRQRQDQRAKRLTETFCEFVRLVDHAECRPHDDPEQPNEYRGAARRSGRVREDVRTEEEEQSHCSPGAQKPNRSTTRHAETTSRLTPVAIPRDTSSPPDQNTPCRRERDRVGSAEALP